MDDRVHIIAEPDNPIAEVRRLIEAGQLPTRTQFVRMFRYWGLSVKQAKAFAAGGLAELRKGSK